MSHHPERTARNVRPVNQPPSFANVNGQPQKKLSARFSPSRTALYCTFSAPFKSKDAYNPASNLYTNVVGYAQSDLDDDGGSVIVTPQFMGIGTTGGVIDLQSIKCNEEAEDLVTLMTLDNIGNTVDTYYWTTYKGAYCWLDDATMKPAEGVEFAPGQAFWVQSDEAGNVFQSAGQVNTSDIVVELDDEGGSVIAGNATPVTIDIQDAYCEEEAEDQVTLMTLDNLGNTVDTYYWTTYKGSYCWLDDATMKPAEGVEFAPGQAFWIQSDDAGFTITFPGVELNN